MPRTPVWSKCEGMEGINPFGRGWQPVQGSGGNAEASMGCGTNGGDGEDGGDNCDPLACARVTSGCGGLVPSTWGLQLSSPSSPSPPLCLQVFDIASVRPLHLLHSILSLFHSILSIPSLKNEGKQGIEKKEQANTKSGKGLSA